MPQPVGHFSGGVVHGQRSELCVGQFACGICVQRAVGGCVKQSFDGQESTAEHGASVNAPGAAALNAAKRCAGSPPPPVPNGHPCVTGQNGEGIGKHCCGCVGQISVGRQNGRKRVGQKTVMSQPIAVAQMALAGCAAAPPGAAAAKFAAPHCGGRVWQASVG